VLTGITVSAPDDRLDLEAIKQLKVLILWLCDATMTGSSSKWHIGNVIGVNSTFAETASVAPESNSEYSSVEHPRALKIRRVSAFGGSTPLPTPSLKPVPEAGFSNIDPPEFQRPRWS
jgi:hypothetical protein